MSLNKVLVLCATGKAGRNVCRALKDAGFQVYGTTRANTKKLSDQGVIPVLCDYTSREDLDRALLETGAKKVFVITDYFGAAKSKGALEISHGKYAIDAARSAEVDHLIFMSVADAELMGERVKHIKTKVVIEDYLRASGVRYSILRPCAFFENFDDPANWNPLKKGRLKFLSEKEIKYCSTYDLGRAAALMFKDPAKWLEKSLDVISWKGDLSQVAAALEKVGGVKVKFGLAMPIFLRKLLLKDLHYMFIYFEDHKGPKGDPEDFKKVLPDAFNAEVWFRFYGAYSNGERI
jgi:nucleoside-diphosphate-sugar epimerase